MNAQQTRLDQRGLALGVGSYALWGLLPLYLHLLGRAGPFEIVAHRILWSIVLLAALLIATRRIGSWIAVFRNVRLLGMLCASSLLIAVNWLVFIWAVVNDHVLAGALGYFITPLVSVLLGVVLLGERLRPLQTGAVAVAAIGVVPLVAGGGGTLPVALALACSFGGYGFVRNRAPVPAIEGLAVETALLAAPALGCLWWLAAHGTGTFGRDPGFDALLIGSGVTTTVPLLMFAGAARRLPLSVLGLLQYIAPSVAFVLATTVFGEPLETRSFVTFAFIWAGLALYVADGVRHARRPMLPE